MSVSTDREDSVDSVPPRTQDILSDILGARTYVRYHRLGVQLVTAAGRSPRLPVSRYYYDTEPPTAVDFVPEVKRGEVEVKAKYAYCEQHGIRYVLLANEWDEDGLSALLQAVSPAPEDGPPTDLLIAPRTKNKENQP